MSTKDRQWQPLEMVSLKWFYLTVRLAVGVSVSMNVSYALQLPHTNLLKRETGILKVGQGHFTNHPVGFCLFASAQCFIVFFQETHSLARCGGSTWEAEVSIISVGLVYIAKSKPTKATK